MTHSARVCEIVRQVLSEHHLFRPDITVTPESSLDDLGADDIDRIGISLRIEGEWGFVVPDQDEREWATVGDVARWLKAMRPISSPSLRKTNHD